MHSPQPRSDIALPVELLLSIFELLRPNDLDRSLLPDLTAIALVSRGFNDVVTSVLYRTVVFPQGVDADVQCEAFYSALRGSPHLGAAVRNLILPFSAFGIDAAYGAYQKLLPASIVALCPNLRALEASAAGTTALFAAISISQIERLSLRNLDPRALREMQVHGYPRLRYLHVDLRGWYLSRRRDTSFETIASQPPTPFLALTSAALSVIGYRRHEHVETIIRDLLSYGKPD